MLSTKNKPSEADRDAILAAFKSIQSSQNWLDVANTNELGLTHKKTTMRPGLFDKSLQDVVSTLQIGETSGVVFIKGVPHILRVMDIKTLPATALSAVSPAIRKKLAATQLRKAVKRASHEAVSNANVVYQR